MLTRDAVFRLVIDDDEALRSSVSLAGRASFLVLCAEAAFLRADLGDSDYRMCCRFLWDCICFLKTLQLPARVFENHVQTREGDAGFLFRSDDDRASKDFWMFFANIAGWFAAVAADSQQDHSYFGDIDQPDSINRIFFAWTNSLPRFLDRKYIADVMRFVMTQFPAKSDGLTSIDYGVVRVSLLEFLNQLPVD